MRRTHEHQLAICDECGEAFSPSIEQGCIVADDVTLCLACASAVQPQWELEDRTWRQRVEVTGVPEPRPSHP